MNKYHLKNTFMYCFKVWDDTSEIHPQLNKCPISSYPMYKMLNDGVVSLIFLQQLDLNVAN